MLPSVGKVTVHSNVMYINPSTSKQLPTLSTMGNTFSPGRKVTHILVRYGGQTMWNSIGLCCCAAMLLWSPALAANKAACLQWRQQGSSCNQWPVSPHC